MALWEQVHQGFLRWTGEPAGKPLVPLPREQCDTAMLFRSILGMTISAAAKQGVQLPSEAHLLNFLVSRLHRILPGVDWQARLCKKRMEYPPDT